MYVCLHRRSIISMTVRCVNKVVITGCGFSKNLKRKTFTVILKKSYGDVWVRGHVTDCVSSVRLIIYLCVLSS